MKKENEYKNESFKEGKLPGLVMNIKDSQSEPWSSDVSSILWFTLKLDAKDGPLDGRKTTTIVKIAKRVKNIFKKSFKGRGVIVVSRISFSSN